MTQSDPHKVIQADPTLRTLTLVALVIVTVVGAAGLVYTGAFLQRVRALATTSPDDAAFMVARTFKMVTVLMAVIPVLVGGYLAQVALRAWHHQEFPPPGTRVLRDTVVTVGPPSRRWSLLGLGVALLLLVGGAILPVLSWRAVDRLLDTTPIQAPR